MPGPYHLRIGGPARVGDHLAGTPRSGMICTQSPL